MAHYVTTIPSSKTPEEAFAFMADIRNFAQWDKGVIKVVQVVGDGAGHDATGACRVHSREHLFERRHKDI